MNNNDSTKSLIKKTLSDLKHDVELLGFTRLGKRNTIVEQLNTKIDLLEKAVNVLIINSKEAVEQIFVPVQNEELENNDKKEIPNRDFTLKELEQYNGLDGKPTYVGYRGYVYDVTDNPYWIKGLHYGIPSGRDLTIEYNSCHAGIELINTMPIVGKIVLDKNNE